jgi:hypothetical protein
MARDVELRPDYSYKYDSSLFAYEHNDLLSRIMRRLGLERAMAEYTLGGEVRGLTPLLDDILDTAQQSETWPRWKYKPTDVRTRVFTPPFAQGEDRAGRTTLTRLHIALPSGVTPQPIVHIEKVFPEELDLDVRAGPEIIWDQQSDAAPMMANVVGPEGSFLFVGPADSPQLWQGAIRTIHEAHSALC